MATKHSKHTKFCISASTEATEMYHLSNFLFLRDQSIGAVFDYSKGIFYVLFIENVATKFLVWRPNFHALVANGDQII